MGSPRRGVKPRGEAPGAPSAVRKAPDRGPESGGPRLAPSAGAQRQPPPRLHENAASCPDAAPPPPPWRTRMARERSSPPESPRSSRPRRARSRPPTEDGARRRRERPAPWFRRPTASPRFDDHLGPYETEYDIAHGYTTERIIILP